MPNLELVGAGGSGQDATVGAGATQILVPAGEMGFTFNPSAATTLFQGPTLRRLHFRDASDGGTASGGVDIKRSNNFLLEDVTFSEFVAGPGFTSDGTGNVNQYGELRNVTFSNNTIGAKHVASNGLRYIGGRFLGPTAPDAGTVAIQHVSGDTLRCLGVVFQGHDILVDLQGGESSSLIGCRYEQFRTAAVRSAVINPSVRGGSINNFSNGSIGNAIILLDGHTGGVFDLDEIVATGSFLDSRTTPVMDYYLIHPDASGGKTELPQTLDLLIGDAAMYRQGVGNLGVRGNFYVQLGLVVDQAEAGHAIYLGGQQDTTMVRHAAGVVAVNGGIIPTTSGSVLRSGTGVPASALGSSGDFFFRLDGGGAGATHLYFNDAGTWIGLA